MTVLHSLGAWVAGKGWVVEGGFVLNARSTNESCLAMPSKYDTSL